MLLIVMLIVAFSILILSVITLNVIIPERHGHNDIMTLSIMTLSIMTLSIMSLCIMTLCTTKLCYYAEWHCAESRNLFIGMRNVVTLNVIIPERHGASYKWKYFIGLLVDNVYLQKGKFDSITATMSILGLINK
jgi:hypothetical protein